MVTVTDTASSSTCPVGVKRVIKTINEQIIKPEKTWAAAHCLIPSVRVAL